MPNCTKTDRTKLRRLPKRGAYDRELIDAILDEAPICHLGLVDGGQPFVIPTIHARVGDELLLHGSSASRAFKTGAGGAPVCVTVTLVDGMVMARSSANPFSRVGKYRSSSTSSGISCGLIAQRSRYSRAVSSVVTSTGSAALKLS